MKTKRRLSSAMRGSFDWLFQKRIRLILKSFPIGFDPLYDIIKDQPDPNKKVIIFDVGANVGQSSLRFKKFFKALEIHAFEPITQTYELLVKNCAAIPGMHSYNLALGSGKGNLEVNVQNESLNNSLMGSIEKNITSLSTQVVKIEALDEIVSNLNIDHIDLLKIDTEGYEIEVLKGSVNSLREGKVKYIYSEVGFNGEMNKVDLSDVIQFLKPYQFRFVGLYETMRIGFNQLPAKFSNALFVHKGHR